MPSESLDPEDWCPPSASGSESTSETDSGLPDGRPVTLRYASAFDTVCARGWHRLALTGLIRDRLTAHFANNGAYIREMKRSVWRNDPSTDINIESFYRWDQAKAGSGKKELIVKPEGMRSSRLAVHDVHSVTPVGNTIFTVQWVGRHVVYANSGLGSDAELLGAEVSQFLLKTGPALKDILNLLDWRVPEVQGPTELAKLVPGAGANVFTVPVEVTWTYNQSWRVEQESVRLRKIGLRILTDTP